MNPRTRCPEILVVDDEPGVRDALRLLPEDDYTISEAANGADALAIARQRTCDLVMLDLLMPGLDGMVVLERLRAHAPTTKVIVLTAVDSSRVAVTAIKLGAFDYLTKPIIEEDLREAIRQALGPLPQASERAQARALVIGHDAGWRSSVAALLSERLGPGAVAAASFDGVPTLTALPPGRVANQPHLLSMAAPDRGDSHQDRCRCSRPDSRWALLLGALLPSRVPAVYQRGSDREQWLLCHLFEILAQ